MSAHYLLQNQPDELAALGERAWQLLQLALVSESLPLLLLPLMVYLAGRALPGVRPRWFWPVLAGAWVLVQVWLALGVMHGFPLSGDESSYLFQSKLLARGLLKGNSPGSLSDFFQAHSVIVSERGVYSKYQLGWPALLALGQWLGQPVLINPLLNAFNLALLWRLSRFFGIPAENWLPALAFSPFFLYNGACYGIHPGSLACVLVFVLSVCNGRWLAAGIAVMALCQIRVVDLILPVLAGLALTPSRRRCLATLAVSLGLGLGLLALCNFVQNGSPGQMGFTLYDPQDRWGLGVYGHSPLRMLWNQTYSLVRWQAWMPLAWVPLVLLGLSARWPGGGKRGWLLAGAALAQLLFYALYYTLGVVEYGPRYWFNAGAVLSILVGPACLKLGRAGLVPSLTAQALVSTLLLSARIGPEVGGNGEMLSGLRQNLRSQGPAVVLVRPGAGGRALDWTRFNSPFLDDPVIFVTFLSPKENQRLLRSLPGRRPMALRVRRDVRGFHLEVLPYAEVKPEAAWLSAGENYLDLKRTAEARQCFLEVLKLNRADPYAQIYLGRIWAAEGNYEQALECYRQALLVEPGRADVRYALALNLERLGRVQEAVPEFERVAREQPDGPEGQRARAWLMGHGGL